MEVTYEHAALRKQFKELDSYIYPYRMLGSNRDSNATNAKYYRWSRQHHLPQ